MLITDCSGVILRIIGGPDPGFKDGSKLINEALSQGLMLHSFYNLLK